jgi:transcription initiation factor TFIIIB Brf1 subunit/transcription initiation factor TFIIB
MEPEGAEVITVVEDPLLKLQRLCDVLDLPLNAREAAQELYISIQVMDLFPNEDQDVVVSAAIYKACKTLRVPLLFRQICQLTNASQKAVGRCFKRLER